MANFSKPLQTEMVPQTGKFICTKMTVLGNWELYKHKRTTKRTALIKGFTIQENYIHKEHIEMILSLTMFIILKKMATQ